MSIPIWLIPWKAKAEIETLQALARASRGLLQNLNDEQEAHLESRRQLGMAHAESARLIRQIDAERDKLANAVKWITLTHGLSGLRVAEGRTVDILKRPKIENKNDLHIVLPPVG